MTRALHLDFEWACELDVRKHGLHRVTKHPSFTITALAFAFDAGAVTSLHWPHTLILPPEIKDHIRAGFPIHAWNASAEVAVLENYYGLKVARGSICCTMQRSLYAGYPGALGEASQVVGVPIQKDLSASRLVLQMARPRSVAPVVTWWHETDAAKLHALEAYCARDVEAERGVANMIPELSAREKIISDIDRRANDRGVRIDRPLVKSMIVLAGQATVKLDAECSLLTGGDVTSPGTQTLRLTNWLQCRIPGLVDIGKESIEQALSPAAGIADPKVRRVLEIRAEVAKSSTKKLQTMLATADEADDRIRGVLAYYGANRTGRWAGRLIQPQNYPRPQWFPKLILQAILDGWSLEDLETLHGSALTAISYVLRGCLVPSPGKRFISVDLAQIEARVIAWLAGQHDVLQVFRDPTKDIYVYAQQRQGLPTRQGGKVVTLGLGFQMGASRFQETAATYGLDLSLAECEQIVGEWRKLNAKIVNFWYACQNVVLEALYAFKSPGPVTMAINDKVKVSVRLDRAGRPLMCIHLPSGRMLFYRHCTIGVGPYGDQITYEGINQTTKRWETTSTYGGKLAENITQAVARDVMADALIEIDRKQWQGARPDLVLSVHDEGLFEIDEAVAEATKTELQAIFNRAPAWARDLPVGSDAKVLARYGK